MSLEILEHVRRLDRHYRKRFSDADLEHQAREFGRKLAGHDALTIRRAVDRVIDDEPHYPTPAKLALACSQLAERTARHSPAVDVSRCGQCGQEATPRVWFRSQRSRRDVPPHGQEGVPEGWVRVERDVCDCQWRFALRQRTEAELEMMGGPADPEIANELRRRAA